MSIRSQKYRSTVLLFQAVLLSYATVAFAEPTDPFLSRFDDLENKDVWYRANFVRKQKGFRTAWERESSSMLDSTGLSLQLSAAPEDSEKEFIGAEVQRTHRSHFGSYEVVMTAASGEGVISAFFTYTGAYYKDPHEELDIEFLGRDTTKVWLNRFYAGRNLPGQWIDLGFDAAEARHLYRLDWLPDELVWYADGRELLRVSAMEVPIPQIPQRVHFNIWAGGEGQDGWSGRAEPGISAEARIFCISYRPPGSDAPMCSDEPLAEVDD